MVVATETIVCGALIQRVPALQRVVARACICFGAAFEALAACLGPIDRPSFTEQLAHHRRCPAGYGGPLQAACR